MTVTLKLNACFILHTFYLLHLSHIQYFCDKNFTYIYNRTVIHPSHIWNVEIDFQAGLRVQV